MERVDGEFRYLIEWSPAWDKRDPDPKKDYGIHGMELRFVLIGSKGATQFLVYTNWVLPQNCKPWDEMVKAHLLQPMPADVGYHAYVAQREGQQPISQSCEYLGGKPCYYDGSGLQAEELFDIFVAEGEDAVWAWLRKRYDRLTEPRETT